MSEQRLVAKVISGLQTGVDQVGLEIAWHAGLATGGTAPKGYRTDAGPAPELGKLYGLEESWSPQYAPRTIKNARTADLTVWFGDMASPGGVLTRTSAELFCANPTADHFRAILDQYTKMRGRPLVLNVAGNRLRTNPAATDQARVVLVEVLR